jgi:hypothetical protein
LCSELGVIKVNLLALLSAQEVARDDGKPALRIADQIHSIYAQSSDAQRVRTERIGSIRVVLSMEDFGAESSPSPPRRRSPLHRRPVAPVAVAPQVAPVISAAPVVATAVPMTTPPVVADNIALAEYQAAWELETWRRAEEVRQRSLWAAESSRRMTILEDEWRQRIRQRDAMMARKHDELADVERRLKETLFDVEKRVSIVFF